MGDLVTGQLSSSFWLNRRVFMTGHTGFKGSWLSLMLSKLSARVTGFALEPPTEPNLFTLAEIGETLNDKRGDVNNYAALKGAMTSAQPEIIFHLAAQPLVKTGYAYPLTTFQTNVMGTAHVLEAARHCASARTVVVATSDKCYENLDHAEGYREGDPLGGADPYSSSKACAELITAAYRSSFFQNEVAVATVRAGNVLGGGDFAPFRVVPDLMRAIAQGKNLVLRQPEATRPWQHVLDSLYGYLLLAEKSFSDSKTFSEAWNFGPGDDCVQSVETLAAKLAQVCGKNGHEIVHDVATHQHEARLLHLNSSKARKLLNWQPQLDFDHMLAWTAEWYAAQVRGDNMADVTSMQADSFLSRCVKLTLPQSSTPQVEKSDDSRKKA